MILRAVNGFDQTLQALADAWSDLGTAYGELSADSSNIVNLVRDNYKKISSTVKVVVPEGTPNHLEIKEQV